MIKPKSLSSEQLSRIEDEWCDSKVVCELLGHVNHLTDTILDLVSKDEPEKGSDDGS